MMIITFLTSAIPVCYDMNMYNSKYKLLGMMMYFRNSNNLDLSKFEYDEQTKTLKPLVIANRNWIWPNYIMYLNNENIVRFEDDISQMNENYIFKDYLLIDVEKFSIIENGKRKW